MNEEREQQQFRLYRVVYFLLLYILVLYCTVDFREKKEEGRHQFRLVVLTETDMNMICIGR